MLRSLPLLSLLICVLFSFDVHAQPDYDRAEHLFTLANEKFHSKDYRAAVQGYTEVARLRPNDPAVYFNRGLAYYELTQFEAAIEDFTKNIELQPDSAYGFAKRALCYKQLRRFNNAISDYSKAIIRLPGNPALYFNRALCYRELGRWHKVIEDYTKCISLSPQPEVLAYLNRGNARDEVGDKEGAIADYRKAAELDPGNAMYWRNMAIVYRSMDNNAEAITAYSRAIAIDRHDTSLYFGRGLAKWNSGDPRAACKDWQLGWNLGGADCQKLAEDNCGPDKTFEE